VTGLLKHQFIVILALLYISLGTLPVAADTPHVSGKDDTKFQQAIEYFLQEQDGLAFPRLSNLANNGNQAAQLFLGRADQVSHSLYLINLDPAERRALMKKSSGKFGKPWLTVLQDDVELADLFLKSQQTGEIYASARRLVALGETDAATRAYLLSLMGATAYESGYRLFLDAWQTGLLPEPVAHLAWLGALLNPGSEFSQKLLDTMLNQAEQGDIRADYIAITASSLVEPEKDLEAAQDALRYLYSGVVSRDASFAAGLQDRLDRFLGMVPRVRFIADHCSRRCPQSTKACIRDAYLAIGGYPGLFEISSPVEALLPNDRFLASNRPWSRIQFSAWKKRKVIPNQCFAEQEEFKAVEELMGKQ
jgi:hypothetical protein